MVKELIANLEFSGNEWEVYLPFTFLPCYARYFSSPASACGSHTLTLALKDANFGL